MFSSNWEKLNPKDIKKEARNRTSFCGAENETRTRDPNLGKVVLYQLSYFRDCITFNSAQNRTRTCMPLDTRT